jgi:uncharacterized protein YqgV (UPF0045/DUF77 family)
MGGIISRRDLVNRKTESVNSGTVLIYPTDKTFKEIKQKVKQITRKLKSGHLNAVLTEYNTLIRG